jgi:hypothetical protein
MEPENPAVDPQNGNASLADRKKQRFLRHPKPTSRRLRGQQGIQVNRFRSFHGRKLDTTAPRVYGEIMAKNGRGRLN